ncbi:MAG: hypothetical protein HDS82_01065 [Bacteroidales bacterium]|nr:hypothetical protein [Bacteroidales bacterium]
MAKIDTVNKYLDDFLAERKPEYREKFMKRSVDNQYASIISWRRRMKLKAEAGEPMATTPSGIVETLRTLRKKLVELPELTERECERLQKEVEAMNDAVVNHAEIRRQRALQELERQAAQIEQRIAALRNN